MRCRWRISVASRSSDEATTASVAYMAWRSRGITCVEIGSGLAPHLVDIGLHARIDVGRGAHRPGDRAGRNLGSRLRKTRLGARELGVGLRELEPEGGGLGVDGVAAADRRRELVLEGALLQRCQQLVDIGQQQVGGAHQLDVEAGVEDVGGGEAGVHEARLGPRARPGA